MSDSPPRGPMRRRGLAFAALLLLGGAAAVVFTGVASRERNDAALKEWTAAQAIPTVSVVSPKPADDSVKLDVPGRLEAFNRASLYARVSGYVMSWSVDIGAAVKAGQMLAEIDAPDLDQQVLQTQADLASAEAGAALSQSTLERRRALLATNAVSRQDVEERTADLASKRAAVRASQANVKRLEAMAGFKRIVAPFEGVVTARDTELGALVSAGGSGPPLFVVSDVRKLRAYVNVPQTYATAVRTATRARISVPEHPGRTFPATFEGSAQAVDVGSGTTRVQLIVDNPNGELLAGGFARVHLELPAGKALQLPATALIFDRMGMRVATLRDDNSVALKPVEISRDLGRSVEIASGLTAGDRVIDNPPDGIVDGEVVRVFGQPAEVPAPPTAASVRPDRRS